MSDRLLIFGMNFAPELAGVGPYTGQIAEFLASRGAHVTVVTTPAHYPGWRVYDGHANTYRRERVGDVEVIRCPLVMRRPMEGVWRLVAPLTFAIAAAPILAWTILSRRPQTVICVVPTLAGAPVALVCAWLVGAHTVLHVQDLEADAAFAVGHLGDRRWLKNLAFAFERGILRSFDKVITVSRRMAEKLRGKGVSDERLAIVRNWVDLQAISPLSSVSDYRRELGFGAGEKIILYSGNIGRKQGLDTVCKAAAQLAHRNDIRFVIAGEGPSKDRLLATFGALPNLAFLPFQPAARLSEFLGMADAHVLPQEPGVADLVLPSKLGGMLASGRPIIVVAAEDTELHDFLKSSVIRVEPGDDRALADAIRGFADARVGEPEKELARRSLASTLSKEIGLARFVNAASDR